MPFRVALTLVFLSLTACSSDEKLDSSSAEGGYKLAERYEKDERYEESIAQFSQVKNKFPYSTLATESELRIADINFKREDFVEAQSGYQTFKELHPSHPKIDYVTLRLGMSFFNQLPTTIDRDLSLAEKAVLYLDEVVTSHPTSSHVAQAQEVKAKILQMLAEKEYYVGEFYYKRRKYDSALSRFEDLLERYPQSGLTAKALKFAAISAHKVKDATKANSYLQRLQAQFGGSKELRDTKGEIGHAE